MKPGALQALAQEATEAIYSAQQVLANALRVADEDRAGTRAASYDGIPGQRSETWCDTHERKVQDCHRHNQHCTGVSVPLSDPTGEAAIRPDPIDHALSELTSAWQRISRDARIVLDRTAWLLRGPETKDEARKREDKRRETAEATERSGLSTKSGERTDYCRVCAHTEHKPGHPRKLPVHKRRIIDGDPIPLCRWCYDWAEQVGRPPTVAEAEQHHAGVRLRRPA